MPYNAYRFEITYLGQDVYQIVVYDCYRNMVDCQNAKAKDVPNVLSSYLKI